MPRQIPPHQLPDPQANLRRAIADCAIDSELGQWMAAHRAELEQLLHEGADWEAAAEHFRRAGLRDGTGQLPTPEMARLTWRALLAG